MERIHSFINIIYIINILIIKINSFFKLTLLINIHILLFNCKYNKLNWIYIITILLII